MRVTIQRALSLVVVTAAGVFAFIGGGAGGLAISALVLLLPLPLIWFPDRIGGATGYIVDPCLPPVSKKTRPIVISILGWSILVVLTTVVFFSALR